MIESVYPAGLSVHEHVHAGEDEMFYLLGGEMEVFCGRTAGPSARAASPSCRATGRIGFTVSTAGSGSPRR